MGTQSCIPALKCRFWGRGGRSWPVLPKGCACTERQGQPCGGFVSKRRHSFPCVTGVSRVGTDVDGEHLELGFCKRKAVLLGHDVIFAGRGKRWPTLTWFGLSVCTRVCMCACMLEYVCMCGACVHELHRCGMCMSARAFLCMSVNIHMSACVYVDACICVTWACVCCLHVSCELMCVNTGAGYMHECPGVCVGVLCGWLGCGLHPVPFLSMGLSFPWWCQRKPRLQSLCPGHACSTG